MKVKGVIGSQTAPLTANMGRADAMTKRGVGAVADSTVPFGSVMTSKVFDKFGRNAEEQLALLLQDPKELAKALERAAAADMVAKGTQKASSMSGQILKENQR
jgi:hypothetical protein